MSQLLVDDIVNKDDTGSPEFSKGVRVTGITTSTSFTGGAGEFTSSAVIGYGVTINGTGIQLAAGIVTAFCAKVGSGVTINPTGIEAVGVAVSAGSFVADGTNVMTAVNAKASTGKAIAMAMVFG